MNDNHDDHDDHDDHGKGKDGHADASGRRYSLRVVSPLSEAAEQAMGDTIASALTVHRALGPGFLESIYQKAMRIELNARGISFECERAIHVKYRGASIAGQRVDLIVNGCIVVELKSVWRWDGIHRAQLISYLRTTGLRGGLLINFRVPILSQGIKRVVL